MNPEDQKRLDQITRPPTVLDFITHDQLHALREAGFVVIHREPTENMIKAAVADKWPEQRSITEQFHRMVAQSIREQNAEINVVGYETRVGTGSQSWDEMTVVNRSVAPFLQAVEGTRVDSERFPGPLPKLNIIEKSFQIETNGDNIEVSGYLREPHGELTRGMPVRATLGELITAKAMLVWEYCQKPEGHWVHLWAPCGDELERDLAKAGMESITKRKAFDGRLCVFYDLNAAYLSGESRQPAVVLNEMGVVFTRWESQPIADQIKLGGVDPSTLPDPLPDFLRIKETPELFEVYDPRQDAP